MSKNTIDLFTVPLTALSERSLMALGTLNRHTHLLTEDGTYRDWRGLLDLADIPLALKASIKTAKDQQMQLLIGTWKKEEGSKNRYLGHLLEFLRRLDRIDIYDDCYDHIIKDAKTSTLLQESIDNGQKVPQGLLTQDDVKQCRINEKLKMYDAFLVFDDDDVDFVVEMKSFMDERRLTYCTQYDYVGGQAFEYNTSMELISKRCRKVVIIISKSFVKNDSRANLFLAKYAAHIGIQKDKRQIVPCMKEPCDIPTDLNHVFHLQYFKHGRLLNFWEKLYDALVIEPGEVINDAYQYSLGARGITNNEAQASTESSSKTRVKVPETKKPEKSEIAAIEEQLANLPSLPSQELSVQSEELLLEGQMKTKKKKKNIFSGFLKGIKSNISPKKNESPC